MKSLKITAFVLLVSTQLFAQQAFKAQSISIFKDGNSFVQKKGTVKTENGIFKLKGKDIPLALYGTFWVHTPTQKIGSVLSYMDTIHAQVPRNVQNMFDILENCKGKNVKLKIGTELIEGNVVDIIKQNIDQAIPNPSNPYETKIQTVLSSCIVHLLLKDGGNRYLNGSTITEITSMEALKSNLFTKERTPTPCLDIEFDNKNATQELDVMYLQKGLTWMPFYNLVLGEKGKAHLELRSEVVNEADDIKDCNLNFVIGAPNFKYATTLSGLVQFLNANRQSYYDQSFNSSNMFSNGNAQVYGAMSMDVNRTGDDGVRNFANNLTGDNVQDLYFYNLKNVSLKKGQRAHYEVFQTDITYEHLYECDLTANNEHQRYYNDYAFDPNLANKVMHSIRIINNTSNPFTTAPVLVTQDRSGTVFPICQDNIKYTPKKGNSCINITNTPEIQVSHSEKEQKRVENFKQWNGYYYDNITIEAKIKVKNYKNETVKMSLHRTVWGDMKTCEVEWNVLKGSPYQNYLHLNNDVVWTFEVKPGEEKEVNYTYDYYYRR